MQRLSTMPKILFSWALGFALSNLILYTALHVYDTTWLPAGLSNSDLSAVVGDSWAITRAGKVHHYLKTNLKTNWWAYIELGSWQEMNYGHPMLTWGQDQQGDIVVATEYGIWTGPRPFYLSAPPLTEPIITVGGLQLCMSNGHTTSIFAASATQIAIYDWANRQWEVRPLPQTVTSPLTVSGCHLYYLASGELGFLTIQIPGDYRMKELSLIDQTAVLPPTAPIIGMASTQLTLWILSETQEVFELVNAENSVTSWEKLSQPPLLSHPRLVSGVAGSMFSPSIEAVDLWLMADEGIYWFNRGKLVWEEFQAIAGLPPQALSSLTRNSETVGTSVTRLAVVNGRAYRERSQVATREVWMLFVGCPATLVLSLIAVGSIIPFTRRRRARIERTHEQDRAS